VIHFAAVRRLPAFAPCEYRPGLGDVYFVKITADGLEVHIADGRPTNWPGFTPRTGLVTHGGTAGHGWRGTLRM